MVTPSYPNLVIICTDTLTYFLHLYLESWGPEGLSSIPVQEDLLPDLVVVCQPLAITISFLEGATINVGGPLDCSYPHPSKKSTFSLFRKE